MVLRKRMTAVQMMYFAEVSVLVVVSVAEKTHLLHLPGRDCISNTRDLLWCQCHGACFLAFPEQERRADSGNEGWGAGVGRRLLGGHLYSGGS